MLDTHNHVRISLHHTSMYVFCCEGCMLMQADERSVGSMIAAALTALTMYELVNKRSWMNGDGKRAER